jgi:hypothetical protein
VFFIRPVAGAAIQISRDYASELSQRREPSLFWARQNRQRQL